MKRLIFLLLFFGLMATAMRAEDFKKLSLPRQEQLSSDRVQQVLQDSEGYLWYATEGGGVCRDDGRQISVFRSDAEHPDLLGSNDVVCLAEAGSRIIIGTFHGAYVLDKQDYTIRKLTDVDDKHVDDIIIADGLRFNIHCGLTYLFFLSSLIHCSFSLLFAADTLCVSSGKLRSGIEDLKDDICYRKY